MSKQVVRVARDIVTVQGKTLYRPLHIMRGNNKTFCREQVGQRLFSDDLFHGILPWDDTEICGKCRTVFHRELVRLKKVPAAPRIISKRKVKHLTVLDFE